MPTARFVSEGWYYSADRMPPHRIMLDKPIAKLQCRKLNNGFKKRKSTKKADREIQRGKRWRESKCEERGKRGREEEERELEEKGRKER